jgi:hypothetical protein
MMWLTTPKLSHSRKGGEKEEFFLREYQKQQDLRGKPSMDSTTLTVPTDEVPVISQTQLFSALIFLLVRTNLRGLTN